jgi:hypothetical protein
MGRAGGSICAAVRNAATSVAATRPQVVTRVSTPEIRATPMSEASNRVKTGSTPSRTRRTSRARSSRRRTHIRSTNPFPAPKGRFRQIGASSSTRASAADIARTGIDSRTRVRLPTRRRSREAETHRHGTNGRRGESKRRLNGDRAGRTRQLRRVLERIRSWSRSLPRRGRCRSVAQRSVSLSESPNAYCQNSRMRSVDVGPVIRTCVRRMPMVPVDRATCAVVPVPPIQP